MFLDLLSPSSSYNFPVIQNIGTLYQVMPDSTQAILTFTGTPYAPGETTLAIQQSIGPSGPWTTMYGRQFTFNGTPYANLAVDLPGPYYKNTYFRYNWENVTMGYVGPWSPVLLGPTVKERWDVHTAPIAPTLIVSATPVNLGFGLPSYVDVVVRQSLINSANFSNMGMYISATGIYHGFPRVETKYFVGWGATVGADETFRIPFGSLGDPITAAPNASAQYYVLGDPLPGILGDICNL